MGNRPDNILYWHKGGWYWSHLQADNSLLIKRAKLILVLKLVIERKKK